MTAPARLHILSARFTSLLSGLTLALLAGCATTGNSSNAGSHLSPPPIAEASFSTEKRARFRSSATTEKLELPDYWNVFLSFPDGEHQTLANEDSAGENPNILLLENADARSIPAFPVRLVRETPPEKQTLVLETPDLWTRIRQGLTLQDTSHPRTRSEIKWYARHQNYLDRTVERARPYMHLIVSEIERRNIPMEIALLPIVESAFQPFAYSHGRAAGIWQFIPSTGKLYGLKQNWWYDGRRDIMEATRAALDFLEDLERAFKGDWLLALAAYNSGQGTVKRAIRKNKRRGKPTDFWSLDLPRETRGYVPKLLAITAVIDKPFLYNVSIKSIEDKPYLTAVHTGTQIDLALAAELAGLPIQEIYRYNPAFNRWATDPDGPHKLLLPLENAADFAVKLSQRPESERVKWARHKIRPGETLSHIADKYRTTVTLLKRINNIRGNMIREGDRLIIPVAGKNLSSYTLSANQRLKAIQNQPSRGYKTSYIVRPGDTLWNIARNNGVRVSSLAKWNGMAPRDTLRTGQKLVIWKKTRSSSAVTGSIPAATTQKVNYVVRNGDSLARISRKFRVKISQLRKWNALPRDKYLQPGQVLTLFVDVTQQSGNL